MHHQVLELRSRNLCMGREGSIRLSTVDTVDRAADLIVGRSAGWCEVKRRFRVKQFSNFEITNLADLVLESGV